MTRLCRFPSYFVWCAVFFVVEKDMRKRCVIGSSSLLGLAVGLAGTGCWGANLENQVVALGGQTPVAGTLGLRIPFADAVINNAGEVAFTGTELRTGQNRMGLYLYRPGMGVELLADGGDGGYLFTPNLSADGSVVYRAPVLVMDDTMMYNPGRAGSVVVATTVPGGAPPPLAGAAYTQFYSSLFYRGGNLAFGGKLAGADIDAQHMEFVATSKDGGAPTFLVRQGATGSAPFGTDNGQTSWVTGFEVDGVNSHGDVAIHGNFAAPPFFPLDPLGPNQSVFAVVDGATQQVTVIAQGGQAVAGLAGVNYVSVSGRMDINDAGSTVWLGRTTFRNTYVASPNVLAERVGGTTTLLFQKGTPVDGASIFLLDRDPIITGNGSVLFEADLVTGNEGLFRYTPAGGIKWLFATRDTAHGPGAGYTFADIRNISANASGDFAFVATVELWQGQFVLDAFTGVYAYRNGVLQLLVRTDAPFDVDPTSGLDERTVRTIQEVTGDSGGQDGHRSYMNDQGDVVFSLTFTDDTGGVFIDHGVATPEVTTLGTLAVGAAGLLGRRRRRRV
jgi:hypothetical protein